MIKSVVSIFLVSIIISACDVKEPKLTLDLDAKKSKNIIIMIADGGGYNQFISTNYYTDGKSNSELYERFPVSFPVCTSPAQSGKFKSKNGLSWANGYNSAMTYSDSVWRTNGVTGSATAATAMATGRKTYNGAIAMDIYFKPLETIAEKAKSLGKSAGVVTAVPFAHATPASFVAHNVLRSNYEEIAQEMIESNIDIIFGCGNPNYDNSGNKITPNDFQYVGGEEYWKKFLESQGNRKLISSKDEFLKLIKNPTRDKLLGLPEVYTTLQEDRDGDKYAIPFSVPFNDNLPSLEDMSLAALNSLNLNENGFFLMIEGGAVDWASHSNYKGRMIEEQTDFNKAVKAVYDWVEKNSSWSETLLIITADHETGYITGINGFDSEIESRGKGEQPLMQFNSTHHTNVLVPLYAKGVGADLFDDYADEVDSLRGYFIQNSEIGQIMFRTIVK
jgi:alkaline phosphatase